MHNLLPDTSKKKILEEYRLRLAVVALLLVFSLGVTIVLSLFPSFVLSLSKEKAVQSEQDNVTKSIQSLESENLNALLSETKEKVNSLNALSAPELSLLIDAVLSKKSPGISISDFTFSSAKDGGRQLSLQGQAATREGLVQFKRDLEADGRWASVSLPIADLAPQTDLLFSMTLSVKNI